MTDFENLKNEFVELLISGEESEAVERSNAVMNQGIKPTDFFEQLFTPAMESVGDKFGRLEIFMPELIQAAETAQAISEQALQPRLRNNGDSDSVKKGKILLASVRGDLHDIGKNMVALMLQVNGFEIVDMGVDVDTRAIIDRAREDKVDIVGLSSLMTTSMPYMKEALEMRTGFGLEDQFAIIVGGAPITEEYCSDIGADAYGNDAVDGVKKCLSLIKEWKSK